MKEQFKLSHRTVWTEINKFSRNLISHSVFDWLVDEGSLTAKLVDLSGDNFKLEVQSQEHRVISPEEKSILELPEIDTVIDRKVLLKGRDAPWIFAHSLIPLSSATVDLKVLKNLNNRSLGEFLFKNSSIVRRSLEIAHMEAKSFGIEAKDIGCRERRWGRRALFSQGRHSLLVSEIFLPALILEIEK